MERAYKIDEVFLTDEDDRYVDGYVTTDGEVLNIAGAGVTVILDANELRQLLAFIEEESKNATDRSNKQST